MDSLNPLSGMSPMIGMWLNCVFGGKGVGMINLLLFLIVGVFLAGQMVGRTPEYLGRKVGAREMKLAMIALLVHPILILGPAGLFAATGWGTTAEANPGAHGFSEIVYQYSSASANNGSAMDGLGVTYGLNNNPNPSPEAVPWDIGTGLVMLFSRYLPIIAPIAMAFSLGRKKVAPVTLGTMSDDTLTFGFLLFGTIAIVGALLFLPVAALGPIAEHLGTDPVRRLTVPAAQARRRLPRRASPSQFRSSSHEHRRHPCSLPGHQPHPTPRSVLVGHHDDRTEAVVRHAASRRAVEEPGHVRCRDRRGPDPPLHHPGEPSASRRARCR